VKLTLLLFAIVFGWLMHACDWQWVYALKYDVKSAQVMIEKKPHSCEWDTSPLGNKHCHYERVISMVLIRWADDGRRLVSYDNETWYLVDPSVSVSPSVTVSWSRVDE